MSERPPLGIRTTIHLNKSNEDDSSSINGRILLNYNENVAENEYEIEYNIIPVTLTRVTIHNHNYHCTGSTTIPKQKQTSSSNDNNLNSRNENEWKRICNDWGMTIVRHIYLLENNNNNNNKNSHDSSASHLQGKKNNYRNVEYEYKVMNATGTITNNGDYNATHNTKNNNKADNKSSLCNRHLCLEGRYYDVHKEQLVISNILTTPTDTNTYIHPLNASDNDGHRSTKNNGSPASHAGIQVGDIIHSIYGMTQPQIQLLFGIMRDSNSFQMEVLRKRKKQQHVQPTSLTPFNTATHDHPFNYDVNNIGKSTSSSIIIVDNNIDKKKQQVSTMTQTNTTPISPLPKNHYLSFNSPRKLFNPYHKPKIKINTTNTQSNTNTKSNPLSITTKSKPSISITATTDTQYSQYFSSSPQKQKQKQAPSQLPTNKSNLNKTSPNNSATTIPNTTIDDATATLKSANNNNNNNNNKNNTPINHSNTIIDINGNNNDNFYDVDRNRIGKNDRFADTANAASITEVKPGTKQQNNDNTTATTDKDQEKMKSLSLSLLVNTSSLSSLSATAMGNNSSSPTTTTTTSTTPITNKDKLIFHNGGTNQKKSKPLKKTHKIISIPCSPQCTTTRSVISENSNMNQEQHNYYNKDHDKEQSNRKRRKISPSLSKTTTSSSTTPIPLYNNNKSQSLSSNDDNIVQTIAKRNISFNSTPYTHDNNTIILHDSENEDNDNNNIIPNVHDDNEIILYDSENEENDKNGVEKTKNNNGFSLFPFPSLNFLPQCNFSRAILLKSIKNQILKIPDDYRILKKKIVHIPTDLSFQPELLPIVQETLDIEMEYLFVDADDVSDKGERMRLLLQKRGTKKKLKNALLDAIEKHKNYKKIENKLFSRLRTSINKTTATNNKKKRKNDQSSSNDNNIQDEQQPTIRSENGKKQALDKQKEKSVKYSNNLADEKKNQFQTPKLSEISESNPINNQSSATAESISYCLKDYNNANMIQSSHENCAQKSNSDLNIVTRKNIFSTVDQIQRTIAAPETKRIPNVLKNTSLLKLSSSNTKENIVNSSLNTESKTLTIDSHSSFSTKPIFETKTAIAVSQPKPSLASLVKQSFSSLTRDSKQSFDMNEDIIFIKENKQIYEQKDLPLTLATTSCNDEFLSPTNKEENDGNDNDNKNIEVVPAKPAAVMKQSILSRGTAITSTSSKAGLSQLKSLKLKRLWPDSTLFTKRIMKWNPPYVSGNEPHNRVKFRGPVLSGKGNKILPQLPHFFDSGMDMRASFASFILEEGMAAVNKEFEINSSPDGDWKRDTYTLHLKSCTPVDPKRCTGALSTVRTYEFAFDLDRKNHSDPPSNLGELFVVYSSAWKSSGCCIGLVGSNDMNSSFLQDQKLESDESVSQFNLWLCVSSNNYENSGWLAESDLPIKLPNGSVKRQSMYALNIGTVARSMREYEAMISIDYLKNHLKNAFFSKSFSRRSTKAFETNQTATDIFTIKKPSSVPAETWRHLSVTLNCFQLLAIEKLMSGKARDNVMLIQGPPGTGKTSTVIGLVSALLNGSCPKPGAKSPGTRVQIGKALSASKSNKNQSFDPGRLNANRILICAPSNFAVDELAWRLKNHALGPHGKLGSLKIIRFGNLPGEERHDGRGKINSVNFSTNDLERDKFLRSINLDEMVEQIARKREVQNFAADRETEVKSRLDRRGTRHISFAQERQNILCDCHVVCCTLSGAGSKAFAEAVARDEFPHSEFDTIIIDEACQASEPSTLIPLKFNPNSLVLVGDPQQLPVVVVSPKASKLGLARSLFERLCENGWPVELLRIQYRMHKEIVSFPSEQFYDAKLINDKSIEERKSAIWHKHEGFPPYLIWNLDQGNMSRTRHGGIRNNSEVDFIMRILRNFGYDFGGLKKISIGIITFYNEQVSLLRVALNRLKKNMKNAFGNISFQISTVDGFQGSEKDIIILSCVRSFIGNSTNQSIGFLSDHRRLNVALTRARHSLWIIGNCNVLSHDPVWKALLDRAYDKNLMAHHKQFTNLIPNNNPGVSQSNLSSKRDNNDIRKKHGKSKRRRK